MPETESKPQEGSTESAEVEKTEPKTFDADYVDKLRKEAAKYRTEAKTNADAAKRLAEIEEAQKSEAQKAADKIAALEREASEARSEALRARVSTETGVPVDLLHGDDEDTIRAAAKAAVEWQEARKKSGNRVPKEGTSTKSGPNDDDDLREFANDLFDRSLVVDG
jgi:hypothetical protein